MEGEDKLNGGELQGVMDGKGNIISHGGSRLKASGGTIHRGDGDAPDAAVGERAIGGREGAANGGAKAKAREERLEGEEENQGGNGVTLAHTIPKGNGRAEIAIDLDLRGGTCEEHLKGRDEGRWEVHGAHGAQEVGVLHTVKGLGSVAEEEEAGDVTGVAVVDEVLDIAGVAEAGLTFLTRNLGGVNEPGENSLEGVSKAAREDFVDGRANGDGAVIREGIARTTLVD